jgi:hypothetical protein
MKQAVQRIADVIIGTPALPDAEQQARTAREAVVMAQVAVDQARAGLDAAHDQGQAEAVLAAESALSVAERELDRTHGRVAAAERRLERARMAQEVGAAEEASKRLVEALSERTKAAATITQALDTLADAVARMDAADLILMRLQDAGHASKDAVPGHNFGAGALRRRVELELARRGVLSTPVAVGVPSIGEWVALCNCTLAGS